MLSRLVTVVCTFIAFSFVNTQSFAQCLRPNVTFQAEAIADVVGVEGTITWTYPPLNTTHPVAFSYHRVALHKYANNNLGAKYAELGGMTSNLPSFDAFPSRFAAVIAFARKMQDGTFLPVNVVVSGQTIFPGTHRYTIMRVDTPIKYYNFYVDGSFYTALLAKDSPTGDQTSFNKADRAIVGGETCFGVEAMNGTYYTYLSYKKHSVGWQLWPNPSLIWAVHAPYYYSILPGSQFSFSSLP